MEAKAQDIRGYLEAIKEHITTWKETINKIPEEALALEKELDKLIRIMAYNYDIGRLGPVLAASLLVDIQNLFKVTKGCDASKPRNLENKLKNYKGRFKDVEGRLIECMKVYELSGHPEAEKKSEVQADDITNPAAKEFWKQSIKVPKMMWWTSRKNTRMLTRKPNHSIRCFKY